MLAGKRKHYVSLLNVISLSIPTSDPGQGTRRAKIEVTSSLGTANTFPMPSKQNRENPNLAVASPPEICTKHQQPPYLSAKFLIIKILPAHAPRSLFIPRILGQKSIPPLRKNRARHPGPGQPPLVAGRPFNPAAPETAPHPAHGFPRRSGSHAPCPPPSD